MTDKELIQMLRRCASDSAGCDDCPMRGEDVCFDIIKGIAADRLETLSKGKTLSWVSVKKYLPPNLGRYLAYSIHDKYLVVLEYQGANFWVDDIGVIHKPTHWMPLPDVSSVMGVENNG